MADILGRRMKRTLISVVVLATLLVVVGFIVVPGLLRSAIEASGREAIGAEVRVDELDLRVFDRGLSFGAMEVAIDPAFRSPYAVRVGDVVAKFDAGTILSDVVVIESVRIDSVHVVIEQRGLRVNAHGLVEALREHALAADSVDAVRYHIRQLKFSNGRVSLVTQFGSSDFDLPDVTLRDVGSETGQSLPQLWHSVMEPLLAESFAATAVQGLRGAIGRELLEWYRRLDASERR
jgi:hypothetical protein